MKIEYMELGRRLGKTTAAIEWLLEQPGSRFLVCATAGQREAFLKHLEFFLRDNSQYTEHNLASRVLGPGDKV